MNVTAHQEKEENEETKKGKRGAGEKKKRKQATNFKNAVCCPSAVVQGAALRKNEGEFPGVTGILGRANSHFDPTQTGPGTAPPR